MQIFELHFNPKLKEEQLFDSFVYEPENAYEKKLGSLYIIGELENAFSSNSKFLNNIAQTVKKNYYTFSIKSPEKALSHTSKKTNDFLSEEVKKENVSWLGNLNFAILSLSNSNLTFTKTGDLKVILLRQGQVIDMGKNLDREEIDPYPLKIFFNTVSGKLIEGDKILVLTKNVFEFFKEQNILSKLSQTENLDAKVLKQIIPSNLFNKDEGVKTSGICFVATLTEKQSKKESGAILFQAEKRALKKLSFLKFPQINLSKLFGWIKVPFISKVERSKIPKKIKVTIKKQDTIVEKLKTKANPLAGGKKKLLLVVILILILLFGFYIFKEASQRKEKEIKVFLEEIQKNIEQAKNLLIFKNEQEANSLFQEAWDKILLLSEKETSLKSEILDMKNLIEENLKKLNKLENIENPEIITDPDPKLFSSGLPKDFVAPSDIFAPYFSNFYFLNKETCEITKYIYLGGTNWSSAEMWNKEKINCSNPKSMTVDGSIWILNSDNTISVYYAGKYKEEININLFPKIENINKIKTKIDIPYLYLLELNFKVKNSLT